MVVSSLSIERELLKHLFGLHTLHDPDSHSPSRQMRNSIKK
jgi:hypothetical protein